MSTRTMDEKSWSGATDPEPMLESLRGRVSDRKLRLFACACCRAIWHLLPDPRARRAVEVAEAFADGKASADDLGVANGDAWRALTRTNSRKFEQAAVHATDRNPWLAATGASLWSAWAVWRSGGARDPNVMWDPFRPAHQRGPCPVPAVLERHALLLRDLVRPFGTARLDRSWLSWEDGLVLRVAQGVYEEHDFARLAVLADALEDAGCADPELLGHLRSGGLHARGCWALDLLLGRS